VTTLANAMGAHPLTMLGLGGIGDLVLTCTGDLSRNRTVGLRIGRGEKLEEITASMGGAHAEGVLTSRSAYQLSRRMGLDCATIEGIYRVLHGAWAAGLGGWVGLHGAWFMGGGVPCCCCMLLLHAVAGAHASLPCKRAVEPKRRGRGPGHGLPREHEPRAEARGS